MADKDYYKTLGVERNATKDDIKKAFKKLALQYHPDRAPEDKKKEYEEKFKAINEAVSVLGDDKKRQQYDQFGSSAFAGGAGGAGFEGFDFSDIMSQFRSGAFGDFDDIFDQLFSGRSGSRGFQGRGGYSRRGRDLLYEAEITLEEAAAGTEKTIQLNKLERCSACKGKGATSFEQCHHCQGSGYLRRTQRTPFGIFQQSGPCGNCQGRGEAPQDKCPECDGEGLQRARKKLEVRFPAGVGEGMRLRVAGEGEVGSNNGPSGDLYVEVHILPHKYFERAGNDVHITVPVSFTQAVFGDEIEVPILQGKAVLKIPPGTDSETVLRMRGKGLPSLDHGAPGDQLVKVRIEVPKKLNKKQGELLKQLKEEKPGKSFLKRVFG